MNSAVDPELGKSVTRSEVCSVSSVRRVAAMLDLDPDAYVEGGLLPRGWQFFLLGADTRRSMLRDDGFPGLGVPMPDLGLPWLLLGGRTVAYHADIPIGAQVRRTSSIVSLARKGTDASPMSVVSVRHELCVLEGENAAVVETQTYLLLTKRGATSGKGATLQWTDVIGRKTVVPDDTMLFQYSALGFNSHKIHIDRCYSRDIEGYTDLVVNGGLTTLLLTEFLRTEMGITPRTLATRHHAPLFSGRDVQLTAERVAQKWRLRACNDSGLLCVEMEVEAQTGGEHGL
jgi:3-methylfumaryl-CoA hydratase